MARIWGGARRWWRNWPGPFGKVPVDTTDPSGLLSPRGRWELLGLVAGVGGGLAFGLLLVLVYMSQHLVPPGGDPGEWIAGSYQLIGEPFPSWYASSDSPPLMFPLLGALVVLGGGPLGGARLFIVVESLLFGGSVYVLGRTLTRTPVTALAIEGFVLVNPTLDALFFSGAYQYLFSFVFMNLTVAYAIRFIRSRRNFHLAVFWLSATAAILSHPSMIAEIPGVLALMGIVLIWMRQLPKELITRWTGRIGAALFVGVAVTWYYLVPRLLGVHQNSFLLKNGYFTVIEHTIGVVFATVVDPFFPHWFWVPATALEAFVLLLAAGGLGIAAVRLLRPTWLTLPWVAVLCWGLAQVVFAYVGFKLQIVTPYVRFGELLILPIIAAAAMAIEGTVYWASTVPEKPPPAPQRWHRRAWRAVRSSPKWSVVVPAVIAVTFFVILAVYTNGQTVPNFQRLETADTNIAHNASFLDMLGFINNSSISGSIMTMAHATSWTRAITHRDVYAPFLPGYALNAPHILIDEQVGFSLNYRYAVTNDLTALCTYGYSAPYSTAFPLYEASYFGLFFPVLRVLPQSIVVNESGVIVPMVTANSGPPRYFLPGPGGSSFETELTGRGANVTILATAIPGTDSGSIIITANATGPVNLTGLSAGLRPSLGQTAWYNLTSDPGTFEWNPNLFQGYGLTRGAVSPATALIAPSAGRNTTAPSASGLNVSVAPAPSLNGRPGAPQHSLTVTITLTSPQSTNFVTGLPPFISSGSVWNSLHAGLFLYERTAVPRAVERAVNPQELGWLQAEFGVTLLWTNGDWQVYLLPTQVVTPAAQGASG
ncbi:MAG TPA: hypothetical protein VEY07_08035 [Thermoplasmata archaeon]|nr:hypothetical protein [Thermoplasmata archaeon]